MSNNYDVKRMNGLRRELSLEHTATFGPQHGKAGAQRSKKEKANCPRRQRKNRDWARD